MQVWTAPGAAWREAAAVPLQLAVGALDHYEQLTNISQPLPKFDLVAVPGKTGAVENWGLVMFDAARWASSTPTQCGCHLFCCYVSKCGADGTDDVAAAAVAGSCIALLVPGPCSAVPM